MQQYAKQVKLLPQGPHFLWIESLILSSHSLYWKSHRLFSTPGTHCSESHTGHQEALPATCSFKGRDFAADSEQGHPLPCCLPCPESKISGNLCHPLSLPTEHQEKYMRGWRGVIDWGTMKVNHSPALGVRRMAYRTGHTKSPLFSPMELNRRSYFPQRIKLTRCWEVSKLAKKKKKCHHQLSNQRGGWVGVLE